MENLPSHLKRKKWGYFLEILIGLYTVKNTELAQSTS